MRDSGGAKERNKVGSHPAYLRKVKKGFGIRGRLDELAILNHLLYVS